MYVFQMTTEIAEEFWKRVIEQDAKTEDERQKILIDMTREGLIKNVSHTHRTKEEYIRDMSREYNVLDVTDNTQYVKDESDNNENTVN